MLVSSATLERGAEEIRAGDQVVRPMANGIFVSAAQLETAARLLKEADHSVANGVVAERPGFIEKDRQDSKQPEILVFQLGILPSTEYRINPDGFLLGQKVDITDRRSETPEERRMKRWDVRMDAV